jgi:septum formation protein
LLKASPGYAQLSTDLPAKSKNHPRFSVLSPDPVDDLLSPPSSFWRAEAPLILASKSEGRRLVLAQAGLPFESQPAAVDERGIEASLGPVGADAVAAELARAKALVVSAGAPGRLVIGADQVASCETRIFGKPEDREAAAELLRFLSGRRHRLHSAIALARDGAVIFETVAHADLTLRPLSDAFIAAYLGAMGDAALTSAGAYQVEGLGAQLFSRVEGDHWTIMGLPIVPLLDALRGLGVLLR